MVDDEADVKVVWRCGIEAEAHEIANSLARVTLSTAYAFGVREKDGRWEVVAVRIDLDPDEP